MNVKTIATGSVPDGYFGDRRNVVFVFHKESGKTLILCASDSQNIFFYGLYSDILPPCVDINEALWNLQGHHGKQRKYIIHRTLI